MDGERCRKMDRESDVESWMRERWMKRVGKSYE
jgi:hypothetical protein